MVKMCAGQVIKTRNECIETNISNTLRDKREKHSWRSVTFKSNTSPWVFFTFFKLYKWYQFVQRITGGWYTSLGILFYTNIIIPTHMNFRPGLLCWPQHYCVLSNLVKSNKNIRLKSKCLDKTGSNTRVHPRKLAPKLKHQKLDRQKLIGKSYYKKGCVSGKKGT